MDSKVIHAQAFIWESKKKLFFFVFVIILTLQGTKVLPHTNIIFLSLHKQVKGGAQGCFRVGSTRHEFM